MNPFQLKFSVKICIIHPFSLKIRANVIKSRHIQAKSYISSTVLHTIMQIGLYFKTNTRPTGRSFRIIIFGLIDCLKVSPVGPQGPLIGGMGARPPLNSRPSGLRYSWGPQGPQIMAEGHASLLLSGLERRLALYTRGPRH